MCQLLAVPHNVSVPSVSARNRLQLPNNYLKETFLKKIRHLRFLTFPWRRRGRAWGRVRGVPYRPDKENYRGWRSAGKRVGTTGRT